MSLFSADLWYHFRCDLPGRRSNSNFWNLADGTWLVGDLLKWSLYRVNLVAVQKVAAQTWSKHEATTCEKSMLERSSMQDHRYRGRGRSAKRYSDCLLYEHGCNTDLDTGWNKYHLGTPQTRYYHAHHERQSITWSVWLPFTCLHNQQSLCKTSWLPYAIRPHSLFQNHG